MKLEIKRNLVVLGVGVAALSVVSFVAAHGGPVTPGVVHSCVNGNSGEIKIVGANANCKNNQSALDWNSQGPAGSAGPAGPAGPTGVLGFYTVIGPIVLADTNRNQDNSIAECDPGDMATGGGYRVERGFIAPENDINIVVSEPTGSGWNVHFTWNFDHVAAGQGLKSIAVCANVTP
jgi:hypothetical protein